MKRTNVIAKPAAPLSKDVRRYRRYSNLIPGNYTLGGSYASYGNNGGLTGGQSSSGTSGSGTFDVTSFIDSLLNTANTIVPSIWGNDNQWLVNSLNSQLTAERRTNTILWVVIGLVLALLVFLVVRKTK